MFVAHRLRTICDSDQILVLKNGEVAETGSHRELLELDGVYAELWNGQCQSRQWISWDYCILTHATVQERTLQDDTDEPVTPQQP